MKKRYICGLLILTLMFVFTSCGERKIADEDGASLRYTYAEIEEEGLAGLFTLNKDKTFSPLPTNVPGFAGLTTNSDLSRYIWYSDSVSNFTSLIPIVTTNTPIVAIYGNDQEMPDIGSWYVERYKFLGSTIGAHITLTEDKKMYISVGDSLSGTTASDTFSTEETNDERHEIIEISNATALPINNVDTNMDVLLGLEHNKVYSFKYLQGTKTKAIDLLADTYIFQSYKFIRLYSPYKKTDKGYFVINLPTNLDPGYYYISDLGFFKYMPSGASEGGEN